MPLALGASALAGRIGAEAGLSAEATIVRAERRWLRELLSVTRRTHYDIDYEFKTERGALVRATGGLVQSRAMAAPDAGRKIRVYYRADNPAESHAVGQDDLLEAAILVGAGLFIWAVGGVFLWQEHRKRGQEPFRGKGA